MQVCAPSAVWRQRVCVEQQDSDRCADGKRTSSQPDVGPDRNKKTHPDVTVRNIIFKCDRPLNNYQINKFKKKQENASLRRNNLYHSSCGVKMGK